MKKIFGVIFFAVIVLISLSALAGSVPEDLLHYDGAHIFFGEVLSYSDGGDVSVCPVKKIKGEVKTGTKQIYSRANAVGDINIKCGNIYLFTYFDENNPTEIFEVTSYDTKTLKLKNTSGDMWKRFQKYLNAGEYEKAEKERINKINAKLTEVGDEITLADLTEITSERCDKVEIGIFGKEEIYEIDKKEFYSLADRIKLVDVENVLVSDPDGIVFRCYGAGDPHEVTIWENCTVEGRRTSMYSAPTGDYVIRAEDYEKLTTLLPKEAQPKMPPLKSLYANFAYWFIYNSKAAYAGGVLILIILVFLTGFLLGRRRKEATDKKKEE